MAGKKTAPLTKEGIESLAQDKPVVYEIKNKNNETVYAGSAKRGRVEDRLKEHLPGAKDPVPGAAKVSIQPKGSIAEAQQAEQRLIKKSKPRHNKRGK